MTNKLSNDDDFIKIAAFDHRGSLEKMIPSFYIEDFKSLIAETFLNEITAILVDPIYGQKSIETARNDMKGVLLTREETGYTDSGQGRDTTLSKFTSEKLLDMGADAIKLLLYFNPQAENAEKQLSVLKEVKEEADSVGLPLLVEPITYPLKDVEYNKAESIIETIGLIMPYTDILKIEYPTDVEEEPLTAAEEYLEIIDTLVKDIPWVLLSRGMDFDKFETAVKLCKEHGADGYAVGRAVWKEVDGMTEWNLIQNFIKTTALERMKRLSDIY